MLLLDPSKTISFGGAHPKFRAYLALAVAYVYHVAAASVSYAHAAMRLVTLITRRPLNASQDVSAGTATSDRPRAMEAPSTAAASTSSCSSTRLTRARCPKSRCSHRSPIQTSADRTAASSFARPAAASMARAGGWSCGAAFRRERAGHRHTPFSRSWCSCRRSSSQRT